MSSRLRVAAAVVAASLAGMSSGSSRASEFDAVGEPRMLTQRIDSCGALDVVAGTDSCTHGSDPAPAGIDASRPRPLESSTPTGGMLEASGAGAVACYGDGVSGKRVHALYVRPSDRPDRASQVIPLIRQWASETDAVVARSAERVGGVRHVRFATRADCALEVGTVTVSDRGDDSLAATIAELAAQGYNRSDRKYLVWMDSTVLCGIANFYLDDRPTDDNANNGSATRPGTVARVDAGCWGLGSRGESVEVHELVHAFGGVQPTAPHATPLGHCHDESDRMCYADGSPGYVATQACAAADEALLDCRNDDYFHVAPPAGSYLATHWNTARSGFLEAALPAPPPGSAVTRVAGPDRVATSLEASRNAFPSSGTATGAVLANDRTFADALTGVPLAARVGGPLLLTGGARLDPRVGEELRRVLRPGATVSLLGGTAALDPAVADDVRGLGYAPVRYGGPDRYATARLIAEQGLGSPDKVLEATGLSFADALAAGAAAAEIGAAVLLTAGNVQSTETARYLATHPTASRWALGGPAAAADPGARRIVGSDRYATARLVAETFFPSPRTIGLANGLTFPDALAGGANIAAHGGPLLLAAPQPPLPQALVDYLRSTGSIERALLFGGRSVLSDSVAVGVAELAS